MDSVEIIINELKLRGHKLTKARRGIIAILNNQVPIEVSEILKQLSAQGITVNKTTIYREIRFLQDQKLIRQIDLRERGKKYELTNQEHHHHLICINCKQVIDFKLPHELKAEKSVIEKQLHFKIIDHSLEFYGLCQQCQKYEKINTKVLYQNSYEY